MTDHLTDSERTLRQAAEKAAKGFLSASNPKVEWELLSKATKLLWLRSADSALRALIAKARAQGITAPKGEKGE